MTAMFPTTVNTRMVIIITMIRIVQLRGRLTSLMVSSCCKASSVSETEVFMTSSAEEINVLFSENDCSDQ